MIGRFFAAIVPLIPGLVSLIEGLARYLEKRAENKAVEIAKKNKDTSGLEDLFKGK